MSNLAELVERQNGIIRIQPLAFDSLDDAEKAYHLYLGQSIGAETCGWVLAMIINDTGNTEILEKWTAPVEPEPEPEPEPEGV